MSLSPLSRARALVADNRRMVGKLVAVTVLMFGFGYALVLASIALVFFLGFIAKSAFFG